jgi:hypothetical protein
MSGSGTSDRWPTPSDGQRLQARLVPLIVRSLSESAQKNLIHARRLTERRSPSVVVQEFFKVFSRTAQLSPLAELRQATSGSIPRL